MEENSDIEELRRRVERDPSSPVLARYAEGLRKSGEIGEAIRIARQGLKLRPNWQSARITLGQALLDSGDAAEARRELEAVLESSPENVLAGRLLAECLERLGDLGNALRHYRSTLALEPSDREVEARVRVLEQRLQHTMVPAGAARPSRIREGSVTGREVLSRPEASDASRRPVDFVDFSDEGIINLKRTPPMIESLGNPNSAVGEALRFLGAKVQDLRRDPSLRCLALTSAMPGEGKSTLAVSLSCAVARETDHRVLLIEADLRRPSMAATLGIPPAEGLSEWLESRIDHVPIRAVEPGGFFLLTAGQAGLARPELLGSPRMGGLLGAAREFFDFVIVDAIPILPVTDTILLQDLVDGFLFVVRSRETPRDAIGDALARLRPGRVKGIVLNDHQEYRDSYKSYAYHRYGMDDGERGRGRGRRRR